MIYRAEHQLIPQSQHRDYLRKLHVAHLEINNRMGRAKQSVVLGPSINGNIMQLISGCSKTFQYTTAGKCSVVT